MVVKLFSLNFKLVCRLRMSRSNSFFYEIRLKEFNRVRRVLGFFDFRNNFLFLNFQVFFFYFLFFSCSIRRLFKKVGGLDFLFIVILGFQFFLRRYGYSITRIYSSRVIKRMNQLLNKILKQSLKRGLTGYTWGKLLCKKYKIIN